MIRIGVLVLFALCLGVSFGAERLEPVARGRRWTRVLEVVAYVSAVAMLLVPVLLLVEGFGVVAQASPEEKRLVLDGVIDGAQPRLALLALPMFVAAGFRFAAARRRLRERAELHAAQKVF